MNAVYFHWIGTGSAFNGTLGHTSFLVETGAPRTLLVDCGATVPLKLIQSGRIGDVTDILLTHMHGDHIGGLEGLAFFLHFVKQRRAEDRPRLHVATDRFAHELWEHALKAGMARSQTVEGDPALASIDTYFDVRVGRHVAIEGLPAVEFRPTLHIPGMENYGLSFSNGVYYSGDTVELPPHTPRIIFQDCQMTGNGGGNVHITYDELLRGLPPEVRAKTYLTHLNETHATRDPLEDGFAGYLMPGQVVDAS